MVYHVGGKKIEISSIKRPWGNHLGIFEVKGNKALESIGLKEKFYFQTPNKFAFDLPENICLPIENESANVHQELLSWHLQKSIDYGMLVSQYSASLTSLRESLSASVL